MIPEQANLTEYELLIQRDLLFLLCFISPPMKHRVSVINVFVKMIFGITCMIIKDCLILL